MKKVFWIHSVNVSDGVAPNGYGSNFVLGARKIQEGLKSALLPEVELQFTSYDMANNHVPVADLIVFNDKDEKYLSDEIKKEGLSIPSEQLFRGEVEQLKETIIKTLGL